MPVIAKPFDLSIGPLIPLVFAANGTLRAQLQQQVQAQDKTPLVFEPFDVLIDTGADTTCISPEVAHKLGLAPQGQIPMSTPSGTSPANTYLVDVGIPFGTAMHVVEGLQAIEFNGASSNYKGLMGRDIICMGDFHISFDGRYTFAI
ncbi:MAG: aspartyl protease family protein [Bacteroidota bacterium]